MHAIEILSSTPATPEIDIDAHEAQLKAKLAVSGLSVLRYSSRVLARSLDLADKIAKHGDRAPVAPELPEFHGWLNQAVTLRAFHESRGGLQGPIATDRGLVAILAHLEPLIEEADKHYND